MQNYPHSCDRNSATYPILTRVKEKKAIGIYEIPSNSLETAVLPTRSTGKNRRDSARFGTIAPRAICIFLCSTKRNVCFADNTHATCSARSNNVGIFKFIALSRNFHLFANGCQVSRRFLLQLCAVSIIATEMKKKVSNQYEKSMRFNIRNVFDLTRYSVWIVLKFRGIRKYTEKDLTIAREKNNVTVDIASR